MKIKMKKFGKMKFNFWILHIKIRLYGNFHENLCEKNFDPFFWTFLTNWGKNQDEDGKIWKMILIFEFSISNLGHMAIFMKICAKNYLTHFAGYFWLIEAKINMKIKKYGKMSPILEFSISKLGYVAILMKIQGKNFWPIFLRHFWPFLKTFLTNRGKNKDEDGKIGKNEFDFWILHIKIRLCGTFHKNLRKMFFFKIFTLEGHTGTEMSRGLRCYTVIEG